MAVGTVSVFDDEHLLLNVTTTKTMTNAKICTGSQLSMDFQEIDVFGVVDVIDNSSVTLDEKQDFVMLVAGRENELRLSAPAFQRVLPVLRLSTSSSG